MSSELSLPLYSRKEPVLLPEFLPKYSDRPLEVGYPVLPVPLTREYTPAPIDMEFMSGAFILAKDVKLTELDPEISSNPASENDSVCVLDWMAARSAGSMSPANVDVRAGTVAAVPVLLPISKLDAVRF